MRIFVLLLLVAFAFWLPSCKPMPNDGIPFYMKVDSVQVLTVDSQGSNTQKITDLWVEANSTNLGAYELPCYFPVLEEGDVRMNISAGIELSGQSGYRVIYPFYQLDTFTLPAHRGQIYSRVPVFTYLPAAEFAFKDNFEGTNNFNNMPLATQATDSNVIYGTRCGKLTVTPTDSNERATQINYVPLTAGQEIWLEFDYKCEVPFWVGYTYKAGSYTSTPQNVLFVNTKNEWNHMYVKLSESVANSTGSTFSMFFEALRPYGSNGGSVYIDNVKLVHALI